MFHKETFSQLKTAYILYLIEGKSKINNTFAFNKIILNILHFTTLYFGIWMFQTISLFGPSVFQLHSLKLFFVYWLQRKNQEHRGARASSLPEDAEQSVDALRHRAALWNILCDGAVYHHSGTPFCLLSRLSQLLKLPIRYVLLLLSTTFYM